jgi:ABC-type transport system involved in cytochrome c biogenesis permease component
MNETLGLVMRTVTLLLVMGLYAVVIQASLRALLEDVKARKWKDAMWSFGLIALSLSAVGTVWHALSFR